MYVVLGGAPGDMPELPPDAPPGSRVEFDSVHGWILISPASGPVVGSPGGGTGASPESGVPSQPFAGVDPLTLLQFEQAGERLSDTAFDIEVCLSEIPQTAGGMTVTLDEEDCGTFDQWPEKNEGPVGGSPDGGTSPRSPIGGRSLLAILGVVAIGVIVIVFALTRGDDEVVTAPSISQPQAAAPSTPAPSVPATDPPAPTTPSTDAITAEPDQPGDALPDPLFIPLSDGSQYAVWALEDDTGTLTYVLHSPPRDTGCLLIGYGITDADAVGDCTITQIGASQPATVLYTADDGSVLVELRIPSTIALTDETGFAQSAVVSVQDAPVVERSDTLSLFGQDYRAA